MDVSAYLAEAAALRLATLIRRRAVRYDERDDIGIACVALRIDPTQEDVGLATATVRFCIVERFLVKKSLPHLPASQLSHEDHQWGFADLGCHQKESSQAG